jgi:hypothetical protein
MEFFCLKTLSQPNQSFCSEFFFFFFQTTNRMDNEKLFEGFPHSKTEDLIDEEPKTAPSELPPRDKTYAYVYKKKGRGFKCKGAFSTPKYSLAYDNTLFDVQTNSATTKSIFRTCELKSIPDLKREVKKCNKELLLTFFYCYNLCAPNELVQFIMHFDTKEKRGSVEKVLHHKGTSIDGKVYLKYPWITDVPVAEMKEMLEI